MPIKKEVCSVCLETDFEEYSLIHKGQTKDEKGGIRSEVEKRCLKYLEKDKILVWLLWI